MQLERVSPVQHRVPQHNWSKEGWAMIKDTHEDFARDCARIFKEELDIHMRAHPEDYDWRNKRKDFEGRLANIIAKRTGKTLEVTECILRDRQRPEDPPNTVTFSVIWDDGEIVSIEINDRMVA